MLRVQCCEPLASNLHLYLHGEFPLKPNLQKLASEYSAIEEMDRLLHRAVSVEEWELIGLAARKIRRREILRDLRASIALAEDSLKETAEAEIFVTKNEKGDPLNRWNKKLSII
jgi:hypothetical protein